MAKKATERKTEETAAQAITAAFDAVDGIQSIDLHEGNRVDNVLSTGVLTLDLITGGGFQRGKIADLVGPEGSGKSTIMQHIIVEAQRIGIPVVLYDFEYSADPTYMKAQGIQLRAFIQRARKKYKAFHYVQGSLGDLAYEHMKDALARMPYIDQSVPGPPVALFIIDSLAAMTPKGRDMVTGDGALGLAAKMHAVHLGDLKGELGAKGALLVTTNQLRADIKGNSAHIEPGGWPVKHYPDYKVKMSRSQSAKSDGAKTNVMRQHIWLRTTKNKAFPPFQQAELEIILGRGIDPAEDAKVFLDAVGKLYTSGNGRYNVLFPQFEGKTTMTWSEFRKLAQNPKFREFLFKLLKQDAAYAAYFKKLNMRNYVYDKDYGDSDGAAVQ